MIIKKLIPFGLFFAIFQNVFCQEITIPYRDGNKWGICNVEAKILIEPKFDRLDFNKSYEKTHEYIISYVNKYEGLIVDGKEILEPTHTSIYEDEGLFYSRSDENGSRTDIILPNGKSIFEKPIAKILYHGRFGTTHVVYHVLNPNLTESLFVYDKKNLKTVQFLYENYHSIVRLDKQSNASQYTLLVKKNPTSNLLIETWDMSKLPSKKNNAGIDYVNEEEYLNYFLDKYYQNSWKKNTDYGVEVEEYSGTGSYEVTEAVEEIPVRKIETTEVEVEVPLKINRQYYLKQIDNKLFLESYTHRNNKDKKLEEIKLNIPTSDIIIKTVNFTEKRANGMDYFNNYVEYRKGSKTGIIFPNDLKNAIEFDFIGSKIYKIIENYSTKEIVFLVGKRDKNNQLKYGLYSNVRKQIVPFIYDDLNEVQYYGKNGNATFIAKLENKFGILQSDGTVLLHCKFPTLKKLINDYRSDGQLFQIEGDDKYGFVYLGNDQTKIVEPIFDFPIQGLIAKYPNIKNRKINENSENQKTMMLIELQDEDNNFIGYANLNGTNYFKK